jgi:hypothetical protein
MRLPAEWTKIIFCYRICHFFPIVKFGCILYIVYRTGLVGPMPLSIMAPVSDQFHTGICSINCVASNLCCEEYMALQITHSFWSKLQRPFNMEDSEKQERRSHLIYVLNITYTFYNCKICKASVVKRSGTCKTTNHYVGFAIDTGNTEQ